MLTEDFDRTKTRLKTITNSNDHRLIYENWLDIKKLLDTIISKLPPLIHSEKYTVTLKPEEILSVNERFLANVLTDLLKLDIVKLPSTSSQVVVISSEAIRQLLRGESITIADRHRFEDYWQEISKFCDFIEKDGERKFPDAYSDSLLMESLRKSVLNLERDKQNISQRISPEMAYETLPETMDRLQAKNDLSDNSSQQTKQEPSKFVIAVKDREIWVNEYFISKPHAVGKNLELFEFVRTKPKESIKKSGLPQVIRDELGKKVFSKILYELGFQGEILKAFFPKRGKSVLWYVGDEITKEDLIKNGVDMKKFLRGLRVADAKNRPV